MKFADRRGVDSVEVARDVVLDLDESGRVVGIDIQHASEIVDLTRLDSEALPVPAGSEKSKPAD